MTKVIRTNDNLTEATFDSKRQKFENFCKEAGYKPDTCLSYKGDKKCFLYRIDETVTMKLDPNNNSIYTIVDEVD